MAFQWGHDQRYNDFGRYMRKLFNGRIQKLSINAGFTCPNRDGSKGVGGCTFCNNETFKPSYCQSDISIVEQVKKGSDLFTKRYPETKFLAYFQAYTNTYGELDNLIKLYEEALKLPKVVGLIIGTRPDCLPDSLLDYFEELQKRVYVSVELGIESTNNDTLIRVNRGHDFESTCDAVNRLHSRKIPVGAHLILGLPGEKDYSANPDRYKVFELDEYLNLIVDFVERLRPDIVLERFASQAPYDLLLAPKWGVKNFEITRMIEKLMEQRDTWQGKLWIY